MKNKSINPKWQRYQHDAAEIFRELGFSVEVDKTVSGVRATHKVDIFVEFRQWGLHNRWVVECKFTKRPVTKSVIETLKSIVTDVGADRGLVLCETGFQKGAKAAAQLTNITLTSISSLKSAAEPDLLKETLSIVEKRALKLSKLVHSFTCTVNDSPTSWTMSIKDGVDKQYWNQSGKIIILTGFISQVKLGQFPVLVSYNELSHKDCILAYNMRDYLEKALKVIEEVEEWASQQKPVNHEP